jgi:hypothetical protein
VDDSKRTSSGSAEEAANLAERTMKTKIIILSGAILFLSTSVFGQELGYGEDHEGKPHLLLCQARIQEPPKPLTCAYHGELTRACKRILNRTAKMLRDNPGTTVTVYGIDDSVGEYLSWRGVEIERILGKPFSGGMLVLVIRRTRPERKK